MAANTQDLFEADLKQMALDHELRLAIDRNYSNVGRYQLLPPDSFQPVLAFEFAWNADHLKVSNVQPKGAIPPLPIYRVAEDLDELERDIVRFLGT